MKLFHEAENITGEPTARATNFTRLTILWQIPELRGGELPLAELGPSARAFHRSGMAYTAPPQVSWRLTPRSLTWLSVAVIAACLLFAKHWRGLWTSYANVPEHGHAFLIPLIVAFLVWQRRDQLAKLDFTGSWVGLTIISAGIALRYFGVVISAWFFVQLGLVLVLVGLAVTFMGARASKALLAPLAFCFFAVPLPDFVLQETSNNLQMISSWLGVQFIRLCDISVHLEGNIIDLGAMKLQVAEACSGLKYLLSLMTLAFIAAYFFSGPMWQKTIIFLSAAPITVLMNSVRIGIVGVTVDRFGRAAAEGVLHDFEGLVIFAGALLLLFGEMAILARLRRNSVALSDAFGFGAPAKGPNPQAQMPRKVPTPFYFAIGMLLVGALLPEVITKKSLVVPHREPFATFPDSVGEWVGKKTPLEKVHLDILKPDDYLQADYTRPGDLPVNVHIQYFESQSKSKAPHSPKVCIPGAGWEIADLRDQMLDLSSHPKQELRVARAIITKGEQSMLVYFWFQQHGRTTAHEYETKIWLLYESIRTGRTDGAMIRLITPIAVSEPKSNADQRLTALVRDLTPLLPTYLPN